MNIEDYFDQLDSLQSNCNCPFFYWIITKEGYIRHTIPLNSNGSNPHSSIPKGKTLTPLTFIHAVWKRETLKVDDWEKAAKLMYLKISFAQKIVRAYNSPIESLKKGEKNREIIRIRKKMTKIFRLPCS